MNNFYAVYNKKGKVISISKDKRTAQEEALRLSNHRWTFQTFKEDWGYLIKDGYSVKKSVIMPKNKFSLCEEIEKIDIKDPTRESDEYDKGRIDFKNEVLKLIN